MKQLEVLNTETVQSLASKISDFGNIGESSAFKALGNVGLMSERINFVPLYRKVSV